MENYYNKVENYYNKVYFSKEWDFNAFISLIHNLVLLKNVLYDSNFETYFSL